MSSRNKSCEYCNNFVYDDEWECYVCEKNLDEDEMERFLKGNFSDCPYYQSNNEYEIVKKQN